MSELISVQGRKMTNHTPPKVKGHDHLVTLPGPVPLAGFRPTTWSSDLRPTPTSGCLWSGVGSTSTTTPLYYLLRYSCASGADLAGTPTGCTCSYDCLRGQPQD